MPLQKLLAFLDENHAPYVRMSHSPAYTAQEIAAVAHIPGKELAKTVMIKVDGKMAMAVLPASEMVDFELLRQVTGSGNVELAHEEEFASLFPNCEVGAMPPFGNLYGIQVFVAESLAEDEEIVFNAGSHTELIRMPYETFSRLVKPKVLTFGAAAIGG